MASFHQAFQVIKRSAGRSAVACAAYRAGARLVDARNGRVSDYAGRRGIAHTEILAPDDTPEWVFDRGQLWNAVEAAEKRSDAQLAREINMALPHELSAAARLQLVRDYVRSEFVARGMVADIAIHEPVAERGDDPRNFHAHVMLTMRQIGVRGFYRTKTREWNSDTVLTEWRGSWAAFQNQALEREGLAARVDHRRLDVQREAAREHGDFAAAAQLDRVPEIHIGPQARAAARRGHRPRSRERLAELRQQPRRRPEEPPRAARVQREVRYPQIDRGSRSSWNAEIVAGNQARAFSRADHRERQAVRLRQSEMRALRAARQADQKLQTWQTPKGAFWQRSRLREAEQQREAWEWHRRQALRRAKRARALLIDVEKILAGLLHVFDLQQRRHRALTIVLSGLGRTPGRSRRSVPDAWF